MATPITCDLCAEGILADLLMTQMQTGNTLGICVRCSPQYLTLLRNSICDTLYGDHPNEATMQDFLAAQDVPIEPEPEEPSPWPHTARTVNRPGRKRRVARELADEAEAAIAAELTTDQPAAE